MAPACELASERRRPCVITRIDSSRLAPVNKPYRAVRIVSRPVRSGAGAPRSASSSAPAVRPEAPNTRVVCRLMTANQGATVTAEATTDPRPRVTKRIGNAQQTSVVIEDASPTTLLTRSVCIVPHSRSGATLRPLTERVQSSRTAGSDQKDGAEEGRTVWIPAQRAFERDCCSGVVMLNDAGRRSRDSDQRTGKLATATTNCCCACSVRAQQASTRRAIRHCPRLRCFQAFPRCGLTAVARVRR